MLKNESVLVGEEQGTPVVPESQCLSSHTTPLPGGRALLCLLSSWQPQGQEVLPAHLGGSGRGEERKLQSSLALHKGKF